MIAINAYLTFCQPRSQWIICFYIVIWQRKYGRWFLVGSNVVGSSLDPLLKILKLGKQVLELGGVKLCGIPPFAVIWAIWKKWNMRSFDGKAFPPIKVLDRSRFSVAGWVSPLPDFWGLALDHIVLNWKEGALSIYFY